ncbi:MAG: exodeoxyribonuclease III, partial [Microbacteriaceae bacterium]|nr:exodeoxyribonuclease III [Microbacteriaceae bacterium]
MRIASWNVNSIRARVERVVDYLVRDDVDVLCMQEIKCRETQFPFEQFTAAGYDVVLHGLNQWNGVAIASRLPITDVRVGFDGMPGFGAPGDDGSLPLEARALAATINDVRLWSLYVPNGRELDHPHFTYKLAWLDALAHDTRAWLAAHPEQPLALLGDWNVAPFDHDVWDMAEFVGSTHVSQAERDAFFAFENVGLADVVRPLVPDGYTYWDYKQLRFPKNEGMRIDFILANPAFAQLVSDAHIARDERKGDGPSDHVPVVVDLTFGD